MNRRRLDDTLRRLWCRMVGHHVKTLRDAIPDESIEAREFRLLFRRAMGTSHYCSRCGEPLTRRDDQ